MLYRRRFGTSISAASQAVTQFLSAGQRIVPVHGAGSLERSADPGLYAGMNVSAPVRPSVPSINTAIRSAGLRVLTPLSSASKSTARVLILPTAAELRRPPSVTLESQCASGDHHFHFRRYRFAESDTRRICSRTLVGEVASITNRSRSGRSQFGCRRAVDVRNACHFANQVREQILRGGQIQRTDTGESEVVIAGGALRLERHAGAGRLSSAAVGRIRTRAVDFEANLRSENLNPADRIAVLMEGTDGRTRSGDVHSGIEAQGSAERSERSAAVYRNDR